MEEFFFHGWMGPCEEIHRSCEFYMKGLKSCFFDCDPWNHFAYQYWRNDGLTESFRDQRGGRGRSVKKIYKEIVKPVP